MVLPVATQEITLDSRHSLGSEVTETMIHTSNMITKLGSTAGLQVVRCGFEHLRKQ